jgi:LacI family transcriptional regulator
MKEKRAVTLSDIGREVGVSTMTVSAVVNGTRSNVRVSDNTRVRIHEAASRLGYRPNAVGRGLINRRMGVIGVMAEFNYDGEFDMVLHQILNGILEECVKFGQHATIYPLNDWIDEGKKVLNSCNGLVDGFVLISPMLSEDIASKLFEAAPYVAIHSSCPLGSALNIDVDNIRGAYMMTRHLIGLGHTRIAHVTGPARRSGTDTRLTGYRMALSDSGIEFDPNLVVSGCYAYKCGQQAAYELLCMYGKSNLPTAIFCANDAIACGVMDGLMSEDISIPRDISVAGFDDALVASLFGVKLTTISQPFHAMGKFAMSRLLSSIDDRLGRTQINREHVASPNNLNLEAYIASMKWVDNTALFEPKLVIRDSVAPPSLNLHGSKLGLNNTEQFPSELSH